MDYTEKLIDGKALSAKIRAELKEKVKDVTIFAKLSLNFAKVKSCPLESINSSNKILEDVFEALVGAIYIDQGTDIAYAFCERFLTPLIKTSTVESLTDAKNRLQEYMQAEHREAVQYVTVETTGPAHDRTFKVNVVYNNIVLATGVGKSKKAAEEDAATKALEKRSV